MGDAQAVDAQRLGVDGVGVDDRRSNGLGNNAVEDAEAAVHSHPELADAAPSQLAERIHRRRYRIFDGLRRVCKRPRNERILRGGAAC